MNGEMNVAILPVIEGKETERFGEAARDPDLWRRAMEEICRRHHIESDRLRRYALGSTIVAATGYGQVVKLFAPYDEAFRHTEWEALLALDGKLPVATPEPLAIGEIEGWPYVVMRELPGMLLCDCWNVIDERDRVRLCREIGEILAALHALPVEPFMPIGPKWESFIERQRAGCVQRQRSRGVVDWWLEQIPGFLDSVTLDDPDPRVPLHTEVMCDHLLARHGADGWHLSGVIDFEPAMAGNRDYEFASVGLFVSAGEERLLREVLTGYGYRADRLDREFSRRAMAYALVHRYSNLAWYLSSVPTRGSRTFEDLALAWWGIE